jgi:PAS domain S-box-containing protein
VDVDSIDMASSEVEIGNSSVVKLPRGRRLRQRAQTLQAVAQAVSSAPDLKSLLDLLVENIVKELDVERATIYLADERLETIADFVTYGVTDEQLPYLLALKGRKIAEFPLGEQLLRAANPIVLRNAMKSDLIPRELTEALQMRATMCVTVRSKETPIAALLLDTSRARTFSRDEIALAKAIADHAAVAIENARLYERVTASEAKYRSIVENAVIGIYQTTPNGRVLAANPTLARLLGYDSVEALLKTSAFDMYVDPEDRLRWRDELERHGVIEVESQLQRRDRKRIWIHDLARVVRDSTGRVLYYEGTLEDITERKQAEERIAHQAQLLSEVNDAMVATDMNSRVSFWNRAAERLYGWKAEEVLGRPISEVIPTRLGHITREQWRRDVLEKGFWRGEARRFSRDGREMVIDLALSLIKDAAGETMGILGVNRDITGQKRVELEREVIFEIIQGITATAHVDELLGLIHESLKRVISAENCFVALYDRETKEFHFSYFADQFDEPPPPQRLGKSCTDYVFRTGRPLLGTPEICRQLCDRGEIEIVGTPSRSWVGIPLKTPSETIGVLVVQSYEKEGAYSERDVEFLASVGAQVAIAIERKRADEALRETGERLSALIQAAPVGIIVLDPEGRVKFWSAAAERMCGWTAEEVLDQPLPIVPPEKRDEHRALRERVLRGEAFTGVEVRRQRRDGSPIDLSLSGTPLQDSDGRVSGIMGVMTDITERKRVETERQAMYEIIQGANVTANLDELLRLVHQSLKQVLYAENCFVTLYDRSTELFSFPYLVDQYDVAPPPQRMGNSCTASVFRTGRPMLITPEVFRRLQAEGEIELIGTPSPSWLGVPLKTPLETIGVLVVQHYEKEGAYSERDLEFLASVGGQIAMAIERKRAEEALRRESEFRRATIQRAAEGLAVCHEISEHPYVRFTVWNEQMREITRYTMDEINERGWYQSVYPDPEVRAKAIERMERMRRGEDLVNEEWEITRSDGEQRVVSISTSVLTTEDGPPQVLALMHDVTERKRAEEALRRSQQRYQNLVESVSDVVFSIDLEGRATYINPIIEQLGGYTPDEVIGRHFAEFVYPEDLELVQQILARRLQGDTRPGEFRMVAKNGDIHVVQSLGQFVMEGNKIVGFTGILRDVTEARRAEARLARIYDLVARYQGQELMDRAAMTVAELLGAPFVFIGEAEDSEGISFLANGWPSSDRSADAHLFGRNPGRLMRALAFYSQGEVQHGKVYDLRDTPCQKVIDERRLYSYSQRLQDLFPDDVLLREWGIECYIGAPITDSAGSVVGIVNAMDRRVREFTETETRILQIVGQRIGAEIERRRREEAQRKLQEQLFQAQKMESVGTLAGGVAHDFNNLLTGIMGFTEIAASELGSVDPQFENLQQVLSLSARARELVRQLLLFSRPAAEGRQICRLHMFLAEIATLLRRTIPENIEIEPILVEEEMNVEVNPSQLQQVLLNLAVNARDAMSDGGRLRIEAAPMSVSRTTAQTHSNVQSGRFVRVTVSDTGEGIPAPILPHIFEPFFTTKEIGKGTGLGLSVAYGIIKAHGGWIEVESQVGQGTSFHIYLPVAEQAGAEHAEGDEEDIVGGTETILIVEDEPTVRTLGRKVLEKLGYRVLIAQDGREAVEVYAAHQDEIDLVLLDVIMPQMSGQRAFEELRRLNPQVKIVLVTGYSPGDVTEDLVLRGAQMVQKPYDMRTLATVVRQCLDNMIGRGATL